MSRRSKNGRRLKRSVSESCIASRSSSPFCCLRRVLDTRKCSTITASSRFLCSSSVTFSKLARAPRRCPFSSVTGDALTEKMRSSFPLGDMLNSCPRTGLPVRMASAQGAASDLSADWAKGSREIGMPVRTSSLIPVVSPKARLARMMRSFWSSTSKPSASVSSASRTRLGTARDGSSCLSTAPQIKVKHQGAEGRQQAAMRHRQATSTAPRFPAPGRQSKPRRCPKPGPEKTVAR